VAKISLRFCISCSEWH